MNIMKVTVDRVALVKQVTNRDEYCAFVSLIQSYSQVKGCKVWKKKYTTRATVALAKKVNVFFQAGMTHGKLYSKIEICPADLKKWHWDELHAALSLGVEDGLVGMARTARVSYIELAADCRNISISEMLPFDRRLLDSWRIPDPPKPPETYYLGQLKSARHIAVYDKARQLLVRKGVKLEHDLTRIEVRQRNLGVRLAGVPLLGNPFSGIGICPLVGARAASKSSAWHEFLDVAEQQGS